MIIEVVAGALFDPEGRVLIAERPAGKSSAGRWEFPGGKREIGESLTAALRRELAEELGIEVEESHCQFMMQFDHAQGDRLIRLHFFKILTWRGAVLSREGQRLRWQSPQSLSTCDILEDDQPFIDLLQGAL